MTRTRASRSWMLALVGVALACVDEPDPTDVGPPPVVEGDPCEWPSGSCVDTVSLLWCDEGTWAIESCPAYCARLGVEVTGFACDTQLGEGAPEQLCACAPGPSGCFPGQGSCDNEDTIRWCTDAWAWTTSSCASVCAQSSLLSLGCDAIGEVAACLCTNTGTACTSEPAVCANSTTLSTCEAGVWTSVDCSEACDLAGSCDPGSPGGATCVCEE